MIKLHSLKKKFILLIGLQLLSFPCKGNPYFIQNPSQTDKKVEYFLKFPSHPQSQNPVIIFIRGHQPEPRSGGKMFLNEGTLENYSQKGFIAVAVSQPGYGHSDGPPDFCGPSVKPLYEVS